MRPLQEELIFCDSTSGGLLGLIGADPPHNVYEEPDSSDEERYFE